LTCYLGPLPRLRPLELHKLGGWLWARFGTTRAATIAAAATTRALGSQGLLHGLIHRVAHVGTRSQADQKCYEILDAHPAPNSLPT